MDWILFIFSDVVHAEEYLWKALNIRRENDATSLDTADTLFELSYLIQKQGSKMKKHEAVELLTNCLDIRTQKLGTDMPIYGYGIAKMWII